MGRRFAHAPCEARCWVRLCEESRLLLTLKLLRKFLLEALLRRELPPLLDLLLVPLRDDHQHLRVRMRTRAPPPAPLCLRAAMKCGDPLSYQFPYDN